MEPPLRTWSFHHFQVPAVKLWGRGYCRKLRIWPPFNFWSAFFTNLGSRRVRNRQKKQPLPCSYVCFCVAKQTRKSEMLRSTKSDLMYLEPFDDPCFDWKRPCFVGVQPPKLRTKRFQVYIWSTPQLHSSHHVTGWGVDPKYIKLLKSWKQHLPQNKGKHDLTLAGKLQSVLAEVKYPTINNRFGKRKNTYHCNLTWKIYSPP